MVWSYVKLSVELENSQLYFGDYFTKMPLPKSVNELQRFLDMINYLAKFIPNITKHTTPLCNLLWKKCFWITKASIRRHRKSKDLSYISNLLKDFRFKATNLLKTDVSSVWLGAFLEQNYGPADSKERHLIGYSSRVL